MADEYGLTGLRDKDGELQAIEHTYEWGGETITIKFRPPTLAEQEELETMDDDEAVDEVERVLDRHMVKPSVPDDSSWTAREMWAYLQGIVQWSMGQDDGIADEIEDAIDERSNGQGN